MVANAADATQVKAARKTRKRTRTTEVEDLRAVLAIQSGRRVLWRILTQCGTFKSTAASDSSLMAYNAGRQDIGHFLLSEITHANPDLLPQLMSEAYKENKV